MRWNKQVDHARCKAIKILNFLKRNFHHTSTSTKEKLHSMLVKPHLGYAIAAWDPYTAKNIMNLERVQNVAARFITRTYGRDTSVTALKNSLGWIPLQEERQKTRITCLYKMIHGSMDINYRQYITPKGERARRGHDQQFQVALVRTDTHAYSFFPRTVKDWNNLSLSVVNQPSINTFKASLNDTSAALKAALRSTPAQQHTPV